MNHHKVKLATWEDSSTHCSFARNDRRFLFGRYKYKRTTVPALRAGWRQIAAATVGCTMFWVVPFNRTGYTSNVAGGRLPMELWCDCPRQSKNFDSLRGAPPLRQICYKYRFFERFYHCFASTKCGKYNPCGYTEPPNTRTIVNCQLSTVNFPRPSPPGTPRAGVESPNCVGCSGGVSG